ncbi:MAG: 3-dehydroquinate synthase [Myxococcota bacterium]
MSKRAKPPLGERPLEARVSAIAAPRDVITLVGFMGAGKTSVGAALATRLGVPFVDLDRAIAEAAGAPIAQLFREFGEVGFRARERQALRGMLTDPQPMVLATGGGTFVDAQMREWLLQRTRTVFLSGTPDTLLKRLGSPEQRAMRPLLRGPDPEKTMRRLLEDRTPMYQQSETTVHTDDLEVPQIVENVVRALGLDRLRGPRTDVRDSRGDGRFTRAEGRAPNAEGRSPNADSRSPNAEGRESVMRHVTFGEATVWSGAPHPVSYFDAAGPELSRAIAEASPGRNALVVSDSNVSRLHLAPLLSHLRAHGKIVTTHVVTAGEDAKRLSVVETLYDALQAAELDREDCVIALGGGVVGDLAGFAASTYMRGVACVQVPTSTLAAVDASLGGKTGVNTERAKNMVGTFTMPRHVFIARAHLMTQPAREHASGLAEVVKMAATLDAVLFHDVLENAQALLGFEAVVTERVMRRSAQLKLQVVEADSHEKNRRAILNYGHTIGHAIERGADYGIPHGEAVALGMIAEAEWAQTERLAPSGIVDTLKAACAALGLPTNWRDYKVDVDALKLDKKRIGGTVRLPIVTTMGACELRSAPMSALTEYITRRSR